MDDTHGIKSDVIPYLRGLERYGEDAVWRTAQAALLEIENLRSEINRLRRHLRGVAESSCHSDAVIHARVGLGQLGVGAALRILKATE